MRSSLNTAIRVPDSVISQVLGSETVILSLESGTYFGLDEVGTRMWSLLSEYGQVMPAYETLLVEYEVGELELEKELLQLIDKLAGFDLLQIYDPGPSENQSAG